MPDIKIKIAASALLIGTQQARPAAAPMARRRMATLAPSEGESIPREQLTVKLTPIGPRGELTDELLLESPQNPAEKFYIPRYRLGTQNVSGALHYEARLEQDGEAWLLKVHLTRYPARTEWLEQGAKPLELPWRVTLSYPVERTSGVTQRGLDFQTVTPDDTGLWATLRLETRPEQDELYRALTSVDSSAHIIVQRQLQVGVPLLLQTEEMARLTRELRRLQLAPVFWIRRIGVDTGYLSAEGGTGHTPTAFLIENLREQPSLSSGDNIRLRTPDGAGAVNGIPGGPVRLGRAEEPPGVEQMILIRRLSSFSSSGERHDFSDGPIVDVERNTVHPFALSFFQLDSDSYMSQPQWGWSFESPLPTDPAFAARERLLAQKKRELDALWKEFSTTHFRVIEANLPLTPLPAPLFLSERLHDYVYSAVRRPEGVKVTGLMRRQVNGRGYYQEEGRPQRFYYLPDRFELAPRPGSPHPQLTIRATTDLDTYLVEYVAAPAVDRERLTHDASDALLTLANSMSPAPFTAVELEPLLGDQLTYSVRVPNGNGWVRQSRLDTAADLHSTFTDVLTLSASGLQQLYDALFTPGATPFCGTLTVQLGTGPGWAREEVPFVGQISGSREDAWSALFDPTIPAQFFRKIDVVAEASLFNETPDVAVTFDLGGVVLLSPQHPRGSVDVGQPIGDFVLHKPDAGTYRYRLTYSTGSGRTTSDWKVGQGNTLRLEAVR